jgi:hypothetical protein
MGKVIPVLLIFSLVLAAPCCDAQPSAKVSDPRIEMVGNTIHRELQSAGYAGALHPVRRSRFPASENIVIRTAFKTHKYPYICKLKFMGSGEMGFHGLFPEKTGDPDGGEMLKKNERM